MPQEYLYSNNAVNKAATPSAVGLEFKYSLAKLVVNVARAAANTSLLPGDFAGMTMSIEGMFNKADLKLADGAFANQSDKKPITLYIKGAAGTTATFEALVLPAVVSPGDVTFVFNIAGERYTYQPAISYASANLYTLNFTIDVSGEPTVVLLNTTIIPRETDGNTYDFEISAGEGIKVKPSSLELEAGATATLNATVYPQSIDGPLNWTTSNASVATVANGVVTAVGSGSAVITVSLVSNPSITADVPVTVVSWVDITSAKLKNYVKPFQGSVLNGLGNGYKELNDWTYTPYWSENTMVRIASGRDGVLSIWTFNSVDYPVTSFTNGKLFQTVELEAGAYVFNTYINETYDNWGDFYIVAVSGDDLPNTDDVKTDANVLAYYKLILDWTPEGTYAIPINSNVKISIEFELSEKTEVSLGFAITFSGHFDGITSGGWYYNQRVFINKVELLNLQ